MLDKIRKNLDNISFCILALVVLLIPISFLPLTVLGLSQTKLSIFVIGTSLSLIFYLVERMRKGSITFSFGLTSVSAILIIGSSFISSFFSINQYKSIIGQLVEFDTSIIILISFVFIFLISILANTQKRILSLLVLFFSSIFISLVYKVIEVIIGNKASLGVIFQRTDTLSGGWSDLTILSVMFLGAMVIFLETKKINKWNFFALCTLLILPFFFIALSDVSFDLYFFKFSLISILAIASIVLFAFVFSLKRVSDVDTQRVEENELNPKIIPSILVLGLAVTLVIFWSPINSFLIKNTKVYYIESRPNWQATYGLSNKVLKERLFFGTGPNTFDTEWNLNKTNDVNNNIFWNNDFSFGVGFIPTTIITNGLVGFLAWILFCISSVVFAVRYLFIKKQSGVDRTLQIIISFGVIGNTFLLFFYSAGVVVWFAWVVFVGLLFAIIRLRSKPKEIKINKSQLSNFASTLIFIIVIILFVYLIHIIILKGVANSYYRKSLLSKNSADAIENIESAISYDKNNSLYYITASQFYAAKLSESLRQQNDIRVGTNDINQNLNTSLSFAIKAEELSHNDFRSKINTGKLLEFFGDIGLEGSKKAATDKYLEASLASPTNPLPFLFISNVFLSINNKSLSSEYLKKALELKSDYSDVPELDNEIKLLINKLDNFSSKQSSSTTTDSKKDEKETKN